MNAVGRAGRAGSKEGGTKPEVEVVEEKFLTVNLRESWKVPRGHRIPSAVRHIRQLVSRHMKAERVKISEELNEKLWGRGIEKPPRRVRVRAVKDKEGQVIVYLA